MTALQSNNQQPPTPQPTTIMSIEALYTGLSPVWRAIVETPVPVPVELWSGPVPVFPPPADVFNALRLCPDPAKIRVVILGQDPYPTRGNAHGLAFSVRTGVAIPASLKNMYKEMDSDIGTSMSLGTNGNLTPWATQGVLLLNDILTVEEGRPMSHKHLKWSELTDTILATVLRESPHVVVVAWGAKAQNKLRTEEITDLIRERKHTVLKAPHPSPLSAHTGFFGSRPFTKINDDLVAHELEPICWSL